MTEPDPTVETSSGPYPRGEVTWWDRVEGRMVSSLSPEPDGHGRLASADLTDAALDALLERAGNRPPERAHDGPCLNYAGQDPACHDEYDSCYLHLDAMERRGVEVRAVIADLMAAVGELRRALAELERERDDLAERFGRASRGDDW